ncbi:probable flap endonuclease 1 homolog isoform X2 [Salvelinus alpinus]|uniref:probable flap endonuclease 1 homolog isoform X2 n=1 Tax=Salvelinus alpinus TaxID=8036 RepID=UPI0039FDB620
MTDDHFSLSNYSSPHSEVIGYSLPKLLDILKITHEEFVDLCILLGCDYCDKIAGLGPKRALTLIQQHRTIENVVLNINRKDTTLTWTEPDEEALVPVSVP